MDDFENFTRDKIVRLRAEADALDKILKEYQAIHARKTSQARRSGGDQPRAGAFGVVMDAINAAGWAGLTLDDMIVAAERDGYAVKRPTLRSQVFQAKQDGELVQIEPGRYRSFHAMSPEEAFGGANAIPQYVRDRFTGTSNTDLTADLDDEIPF